MSRITVLLMVTCAYMGTAALSGCVSNDAYRYEDIKTEYAELACNLDPSPTADATTGTCAINGKLTLEEILSIAKANNPDLLMALARIERAAAMLEKSTAPFYPRIDVCIGRDYSRGYLCRLRGFGSRIGL